SCFVSCAAARLVLLSFPTRRSSDLHLVAFELIFSMVFSYLFYSVCKHILAFYSLVLPGHLLMFLYIHRQLIYLCLELISPHLFVDRKSTRLNSSHLSISYAVLCLHK